MKLGTWTVLLWLELVGLTVLTAWAQGPGPTSIPIKLKDGYLVVAKGSVGSLDNLTFLVDTGTSRTLMDSRIAKQLQLAGVAHKLTVFDHEVDVKLVVLPDLRLGAIHARSPQVIVTNLSGVAQRFGLHVDAIVGMDILRLDRFAIDYDSRRMSFGDDEPMPSALPLEQNQPYLILKGKLDDLPVTLMIDTGCEDVVLFANRFPVELKKGYLQISQALTVGGEAPITQIRPGKLAVGTFPAHQVRFQVIATGGNDMGYDGIVGVRALQASRIQVDVERMTVSLR
jgi:predicted aspartyl protease